MKTKINFDIIIITGPQGSGKGTQAQILSSKLGVPTLSVGQMLRDEIESGSDLGQKVAPILKAGNLVNPELVVEMLFKRLQSADLVNGVVIDGFTRNDAQFKMFNKIFVDLDRHVTHMIFLDIPDEVSLVRLSSRVLCEKCGTNFNLVSNKPKIVGLCDNCGTNLIRRADDEPRAIATRLKLFHEQTRPIVEYYRKEGVLITINGNQSIEMVTADIAKAMGLE